MASGGSSLRGAKTDPRKFLGHRTYRQDTEDQSSLGSSARQEDRPNNWDFSDWRPSSTLDTGKRIKKGNSEKEKENKWEREQSVSQDSDPGENVRHRTPATFPRTKVSSATTLSTRLALENLRQHLTFSDAEEHASLDGEPNNERYIPRRKERPPNYTLQNMSSARNEVTSASSDVTSNRNANITKEEEDTPDSNQIVGRLMQIRDYIKQASAMMDNLRKSTDSGDQSRAKQLEQVIIRLKEQESKYLDLLLKLSTTREGESLFQQNSGESAQSQRESESEAASVDLDVQSDTSDNTTDVRENEDVLLCIPYAKDAVGVTNDVRPRIEDKLGCDSEEEDPPSARSNKTFESDNTLVAERVSSPTANDLLAQRSLLETDLQKKNDELDALKQQHDLLKKMLYQQEQLKALQGRQAALMALQREAESKLAQEQGQNNETAGAATMQLAPTNSSTATNSEPEEGAAASAADIDMIPAELKDLRRRLDYLKNIYNIPDEFEERQSVNAGSEMSSLSVERHNLHDKLHDLQEKKVHMDDLLRELQNLHQQRHAIRNNDVEANSASSSAVHLLDSMSATLSANHTASEAQDILRKLDSRKKLKGMADGEELDSGGHQKVKKLQEVRGRLNQLRDLVQYYQSGTEFIHGQDNDHTSSKELLPPINLREMTARDAVADKFRRYGSGSISESQQESLENSIVDNNTDTESQLSATAWQDDPEIQEKVRKLKSAKDKLHRLQELVGMVHTAPGQFTGDLSDLAALANSLDEVDILMETSQQITTSLPPHSETTGQAAHHEQREEAYEAKMKEQRAELDQLMDERRKLLAIQDQLQKLYDQLPAGMKIEPEEDDEEEVVDEEPEQVQAETRRESRRQDVTQVKAVSEATQVTFQEPLETVASYDELYGQMRQQRMLREELREKKKELEYMMRKDRPRKTYGRNQDNQSDNISFSNKSDPFGTQSGDMTMATWGGSTVDNLESIEEDENGSGAGQEAEEIDDGYPSDGIVQVEEEEEANAESDDHDTYTIEDDYQLRSRTSRNLNPPIIDSGTTKSSQRKHRRRATPQTNRQYPFNYWEPDDDTRLNNAPQVKPRSRGRKKQTPSGTRREMQELRHQIEDMSKQMLALATMQQSGGMVGFGGMSPLLSQTAHYSTQLQQQQLLLSLNQSYQQLLQQQQESTDRLRRLETLFIHNQMPNDDTARLESFRKQRTSDSSRLSPRASTSQGAGHGAYSNNPFVIEPQPFQNDSYAYLHDHDAYASNKGYESLEDMATGMSDTVPNSFRQLPSASTELNNLNRLKSKKNNHQDSANCLRAASRDNEVPIQTIQASDQRIPPLNLEHLLNSSRLSGRSRDPAGAQSQDKQDDNYDDVIGRKFPTPSRASAASRLASLRMPASGRPGLSADISGTAYETASVSSYVSSVPGEGSIAEYPHIIKQRLQQQSVQPTELHSRKQDNPQDGEAVNPADMPMFENLRETIYSEVATLISHNESRPHYLIELFRQLQQLDSDYLRQRALYVLQDLVSKHLTEGDVKPSDKKGNVYNSQTKEKVQASSSHSAGASNITEQERFDYVENVDTISSLSTPTSSQHSPFAKESLGDTVIHLDKALQRMREYERRLHESNTKDPNGASPSNTRAIKEATVKPKECESDVASSSAQDQGTDNESVSDVPYPRIDTGQLDSQIKSIMTEVIPVLKEHMDDLCSQQLLQYIRRLILSLTKHTDDSHEFVRFFHKQLGSILQDSLAKFEGRKMRECGEDLLVDLSEILFNELAFFRLMQDLDDPKAKVRAKLRNWRQDSQTSTETDRTGSQGEDAAREEDADSQTSTTSTSTTSSAVSTDDEDEEDNEQSEGGRDEDEASRCEEEEEEERGEAENLAKARDDAFAAQVEIVEADDDSESPVKSPVKIHLAPSETKPFTRIGSDEDDDGETDEDHSADDPSETAVSRDAENHPDEVDSDNEGEPAHSEQSREDGAAAAAAEEIIVENGSGEPVKESADSAVNGEVNGVGAEDIEVTLDDLPPKIVGLTKEQLDAAMAKEEQQNAVALLKDIDSGPFELAGDPTLIKEPGS